MITSQRDITVKQNWVVQFACEISKKDCVESIYASREDLNCIKLSLIRIEIDWYEKLKRASNSTGRKSISDTRQIPIPIEAWKYEWWVDRLRVAVHVLAQLLPSARRTLPASDYYGWYMRSSKLWYIYTHAACDPKEGADEPDCFLYSACKAWFVSDLIARRACVQLTGALLVSFRYYVTFKSILEREEKKGCNSYFRL